MQEPALDNSTSCSQELQEECTEVIKQLRMNDKTNDITFN